MHSVFIFIMAVILYQLNVILWFFKMNIYYPFNHSCASLWREYLYCSACRRCGSLWTKYMHYPFDHSCASLWTEFMYCPFCQSSDFLWTECMHCPFCHRCASLWKCYMHYPVYHGYVVVCLFVWCFYEQTPCTLRFAIVSLWTEYAIKFWSQLCFFMNAVHALCITFWSFMSLLMNRIHVLFIWYYMSFFLSRVHVLFINVCS